MATAKQLAWRKKFAAMAKAGAFKKKRRKNPTTSTRSEVRSPTRTSTSTKADTRGNVTVTGGAGRGATTVNLSQRKANPARKKTTARKSISRPSQITKRAPTKRLKERRAMPSKAGYFPNPRMIGVYEVKGGATISKRGIEGQKGKLLASFTTKPAAAEYAKALSYKTGKPYLVG